MIRNHVRAQNTLYTSTQTMWWYLWQRKVIGIRQTSEISRPKPRTEVLVTIDLSNFSDRFLQTSYFWVVKKINFIQVKFLGNSDSQTSVHVFNIQMQCIFVKEYLII